MFPNDLIGKRVISLTQPWATFIMVGLKNYETRSWQTKYRGSLLIHATRETDESYCSRPEIDALIKQYNITSFPNGVLLGECRLLNCYKTEFTVNKMTKQELLVGDFGDRRYAWEFNDYSERIVFDNPISVRGNMGLWTLKAKHLGIDDISNPKLFDKVD